MNSAGPRRRTIRVTDIAVFLALVLQSCASAPPARRVSECVPTEPECKPGTSTAICIDTSKMLYGLFKYHIDLLPQAINTNSDENAIAFLKKDNSIIALASVEREGGTESSKHDNDVHQQVLQSVLLPDLQFTTLDAIISDGLFSEVGAACYCAIEQKVYFAAKADNTDPNDYDLYCAEVSNTGSRIEWKSPKKITEINKEHYFDSQPAVSPDGLTIVFASDRPGGYGGVDLWQSHRRSIKEQWSEPVSAGPAVNTACDELSPSYSADGKRLFFASNGHATIGGYDLFVCEIREHTLQEAKNVGAPINSKYDELFPFELSDSQFFYSSNEPASVSGRNLLVLRRSVPNHNTPLQTASVPSNVFAEATLSEPIPDTIRLSGTVKLPPHLDTLSPEVFVRDVAKDSEIARQKVDTSGSYSFDVPKGKVYDVGAEVKDKFYDLHRVDLQNPTQSHVYLPPLAIPDTLVIRINFPFDDASHPYDFIISENGERTETKWQTSIDLLAHSIKNSSDRLDKVILYGHTDSAGTDEYNRNLAYRRAKFIADELEARGIRAKLLSIIPRGRTLPLARREGESDETYALRCRRVEFIKVFKKEGVR